MSADECIAEVNKALEKAGWHTIVFNSPSEEQKRRLLEWFRLQEPQATFHYYGHDPTRN